MASIIYRGLLTWEYLAPPKGFFGVGGSEAGVLCAGDLGRFPVGNLIWETVRTSSSALQPFWLHTHETYSQSHWTLLTEERQTCPIFDFFLPQTERENNTDHTRKTWQNRIQIKHDLLQDFNSKDIFQDNCWTAAAWRFPAASCKFRKVQRRKRRWTIDRLYPAVRTWSGSLRKVHNASGGAQKYAHTRGWNRDNNSRAADILHRAGRQ